MYGYVLLDTLVTTAETVASTRSRLAKVDALAALLADLDPEEIAPAVGFLVGKARQGRVGVGWRGLKGAMGEPASEASLTVDDLDALLDRLAAVSGSGSAGERNRALRDFTAQATAREQDFIARVLLGEMRTGALEGVLMDAIARAADRPGDSVRRAAMLSGNLGETARLALTGTAEELDAVGLVVGRPVLPMLAASAPSAAEALATTGEASVEYKLDGARIQVHRHGDEVRVFTRNLADITHRVPEVVEVARRLPVRDVILDGETLSLDEDGAPRPFQETMSRFARWSSGAARSDAATPAPKEPATEGPDAVRETVLHPWFFDILHVDGRDLLDEPLSTRLAELERVAGDHRIPGEVTADPEVAERVSRDALTAGQEGVVVKAIDSPYAAGRRGSSWVKVKPVHTYDLVVLAVEWGSGRRQGLLSNIHLGARDPEGAFGEPGGFVMVGKTFKGLTDKLLAWQTEHFQEIEVRRTAGTVWVAPTTVVEIAIDGVQRSTRYPGGIALRFARVKRYRDDKDAGEADTIETLRGLLRE
ncbi:DNA ligase-1 [Leifsonia sp. 98AMF]|nr:DNA ligase-1 [Leifsonia sp. 197AMF]SDI74056.1 DNA ligase-1 [Leifsonia sp. 466MF]SDK14063.1 DNA ligase-1 [Leifsonia sp. 157MF]SDN77098.1 DNA ligase-1 [Leifsonia sp. 509MF]SEN30718.1 DNA ligase-1 [Leifsonia sp. 467MF]SFL76293.1 DNA ligase-1 [Leifsonia sp. 98AMF]